MPYNFSPFKLKVAEVNDWLIKEFASVRTGRATPSLLDGIEVLSYGSKASIREVASIAVEDAKTLRVVPWDASQVKEVEKAVTLADLGLSVAVDDKGLRVIFPDLTAERRQSLIKIARQKLEEAKISMRKERDRVWNDIQTKEKAGTLTEDEKFRFKDEMQKIVDDAQKKFDEMATRKETEISQ
ncbi:MAG: ribosome recycling factor [Patescibacteria group bacterium]|nr:ribosome recycling factor [bacterium]MDZ4240647.1 ribosome recycling factor [Patescibacteria group bacterium]